MYRKCCEEKLNKEGKPFLYEKLEQLDIFQPLIDQTHLQKTRVV